MLEILIIIVIIMAVKKSREKASSRTAPPNQAPARPQKPSLSRPPVDRAALSKHTTSGKTGRAVSKTASSRTEQKTRSYVQPSKPYRPAHNAAERYEEWMPLSDGKEVVRCSYCGAENQIPKGSGPGRFTCYFCREEL